MFKFTKKDLIEIIPDVVLIFIFILSVVGVFFLADTMYIGIGRCDKEKNEIYSGDGLRNDNEKENYLSKNDINNNIRWSVSEKIHINEKNVTLIKTAGNNFCYIIFNNNNNNDNNKKGEILKIVEKVSEEKVIEIAGEYGMKYCNNTPTFVVQKKDYLKKDNNYLNHIRRRKQTDPTKLPNCKDLLLDCTPNTIGKVTECGTWRDQSMNMERVCLSPTEFQVTLYKPNEMMANKLHLETKLVCEERLKHGLSC
uniref:DUF5857 domain-containing protein n=1 Tax=Strongyloides stercoralis TaxID=6248 RepID=A0A0K0EIV2_STRER